MTFDQIKTALAVEGVRLWLEGDRVRYEPVAAVGNTLLGAMRLHKAELVGWLAGPAMTPEQQEAFDERAAILEFDGGFTRAEAERRAMA